MTKSRCACGHWSDENGCGLVGPSADDTPSDTERLNWLSGNPIGLRAIDGNSGHAGPVNVRDLIDRAIRREREGEA